MEFNEIRKLAKALTKTKYNNTLNYSLDGTTLTEEAMNATLREELFNICKNEYGYEKNKYDLFALIAETVDAKMPPRIERKLEGAVKVYNFGENDKAEIEIKRPNTNARNRAFVTKVSPAGVYEVFRLGKKGKVTVEMTAVGGACQIAFEDFLTGRVDWNEMIDILSEGMEDRIYDEVMKMFAKIEKSLPAANKASTSNFDAKAFNKVLDVISVYGKPNVYCTEAFAREITEGNVWASEKEKEARRNVGYLGEYKGARIVVLPQSFTDETNSTKVVDPSKAYILPSGRDELMAVAFQGDTHIKEVESQSDWSKELHTYKKFGAAAFVYNDLGVYEITSLKA